MANKRKTIPTYIDLEPQEYNRFGAIARLDGFTIGALLGELARKYLKKRGDELKGIVDSATNAK